MSENVMVLSTERAARRQEIEMRIEMHRDNASCSLLEIGRQLNAAKDEGVVPHGEWTAWVAAHAAMSERTAQKWMQAARELPPGSPLGGLGIAKIQSLMMLESGEREEFAEKIGAQQLTSREVDAAVKAARAERDEALRVVGEQKKRLQNAEQEKISAVIDAAKAAREDVIREKQGEIDRLNDFATKTERARRRLVEEVTEMRQQADAARMDAAMLREKLEQASGMPDPEQAQRIAQLEELLATRDAAIKQKESEIDQLSDELDRAQLRIARGGMSPAEHSPVKAILDAVGALMASAGQAPAQLRYLQGLDDETAMLLDAQTQSVARWAQAIHAAIYERGKSR